MKLTEEQIAAHLELSPHNLAFVETALGEPAFRRRESFPEIAARIALPHYPMQNWPTLVGRETVDELAHLAREFHRIVLAMPERVFGGDLGRIADFYGLDRPFAERTLGDPAGIARAPSRGDYIWTSSGLKCLEFNCGNSLGGWQMPLVVRHYLDNALIAGFLRRHRLTVEHRNCMRLFFEHMIGEAVAAGTAADGEANIAFVLYPSDPDSEYARLLAPQLPGIQESFRPTDLYAAEMRDALSAFPGLERGEIVYCSYAGLSVRDGACWLGDRRIHAVAEVVGFPTPEVFGCYRKGGFQLYSGPVSMILGDKRNLALLSRAVDEGDGPWTEEERTFLRRHVPWTRQVDRGRVTYRGEEASLPELLAAERHDLVLKHAQAFGGFSVHVGRALTTAAWSEAVERALGEAAWIVQEHVASRPYVYQNGDDGCCDHTVIWGLFVYGGRYTGALVRLQPAAGAPVVNINQGAMASPLLEID